MGDSDHFTSLLNEAIEGNLEAEQKVITVVYREMRERAGKLMAKEGAIRFMRRLTR